MQEDIKNILKEHIEVIKLLEGQIEVIKETGKVIIEALKQENKILAAGNGGSAADAQHFVGELVGKFEKDRRALPAVDLSTNSSSLTAIANDSNFEKVFSRQIESLAKKGDIFVSLSTSGNSLNIIKALEKAKEMGCVTVGLSGKGGGKMKENCDILIPVQSIQTPRIQEAHILIIHILCKLIEEALFND